MGLGDRYHYYRYVADDGAAYSVKVSEVVAYTGGFTGPIKPESLPSWTFGRDAMRWGEYVDDDGHVLHLPIANNKDPLWNAAADIVHRGRYYYIVGYREESAGLVNLGG